MQEQPLVEKSILNKLHRLPPERISEVVDFVDFLSQRHGIENEPTLTQSAAAASARAFQKVWDNPEDVVYDNL